MEDDSSNPTSSQGFRPKWVIRAHNTVDFAEGLIEEVRVTARTVAYNLGLIIGTLGESTSQVTTCASRVAQAAERFVRAWS